MKEFIANKKQDLVNFLAMRMSADNSIFNLVFDVYNEYQESEHDGLDYIFNLDNKDDLIACIKGGLTAEQIHEMVANNTMGLKYTKFFFYGTNHPIPEQITFKELKTNLIAYLDEIVDYIIAYPFDGACRELYTILITNPMIVDKEDFDQYKNAKNMVQVSHSFLESLYDLTYLAGLDNLHGKIIEDSRELFVMLKEWATEFEDKYPLTEEQMGDFSIVHGIDYLTAIDKFYIEKRNEYMADYHNITSAVVLNTLFKNKC